MALNRTVLSLVSDGQGHIDAGFAATSPEEWAHAQMRLRYGHALLDEDDAYSFPRQCFDSLVAERKALSSWFDDCGRLSPLLQSAFLLNRFSGPVGDGIGWDFRPNGDPEPRMLLFKGTLIAVTRSSALIPAEQRNRGNMQFGGLATMVRSAYTERAALHTWRGDDTSGIDPADMSRRWVSHMTYTFLLRIGAEREWAWDASKCRKVFGPVDERSLG